jgi:HlyD family secretion protein
VAILAAIGGAAYFWRARKKNPANAEPTPVRLEKVVRGNLSEVIQAPGEIEPKTKVSISAKVAARLIELPYKEGDVVTKGDPSANPPTTASVLVRLDATDLEAALRSVQARYAAQKAQISVGRARIAAQNSQIDGHRMVLREAARELLREEALLKAGHSSQSTFDEIKRKADQSRVDLDAALHSLEADESNLTATLHSLEAAEAEITKAREDLSYATITSPIDGVVTRVNAKVGELVMTGTMNNAGTVILEVADLSNMLLVARIDENDIAAVKPGQRAHATVQAYHERVFDGTVTSVALAPKEKEGIKNFTAQILLKTDGERILSGLTADVDIETSHHAGVLKIPSQCVLGRPVEELPPAIRAALSEKEKEGSVATVVCRMVDGKAVMTPVRIGPSDATHTIIESGLGENDRVIAGPYKVLEKITHEQRVKDEAETTATLTSKQGKDKSTTATASKKP